MDKGNRNYLFFSAVIAALFFAAIIVSGFIYRYFSISTYKHILLAIIMVTILVTLLLLSSMAAVYSIYTRKRAGKVLLWLAKLGMKVFLPLTAFVTGLFKGDKDSIRRYYVEVNNIMVQAGAVKFKRDDVLVLLPHCLQNSDCRHKITGGIDRCHKCGKCCIGDIVKVIGETGVKAFVVGGGTAARNTVAREKPKIILSVACERDLMSGISDVYGIPVIGIINERANGPCFNTSVDVEIFKQKLMSILE